MHSLAKWHIPQSAQQSSSKSHIWEILEINSNPLTSFSVCQQQGPLLPFANGRQTSENFKISLKSPNTLKNSTPPSLGNIGGGGPSLPGLGNGSSGSSSNSSSSSIAQLNAAALGLGPSVSILSNVTSTNPKTPSPSTHEVRDQIYHMVSSFITWFICHIEYQGFYRAH